MRNALTQDRTCLFIDQYGNTVYASTRAALRDQVGGGRVSKMYQDTRDGRTLWTGYVIGDRWFSCFAPCRVEA